MLAHGPNGNPPERPAMTQRNCPPDDDAVNPSCEVVPSAPSTTPPQLTRGSDAYAASCDPSSAQSANATTKTARPAKCFMKTPPLCIAPRGIALGVRGRRSARLLPVESLAELRKRRL